MEGGGQEDDVVAASGVAVGQDTGGCRAAEGRTPAAGNRCETAARPNTSPLLSEHLETWINSFRAFCISLACPFCRGLAIVSFVQAGRQKTVDGLGQKQGR